MTHIENVRGNGVPNSVLMLNNQVVIPSNIHQYSQETDNGTINGYEYDCDIYTKDQYIILMAGQTQKIAELEDQLAAAKILLGVD